MDKTNYIIKLHLLNFLLIMITLIFIIIIIGFLINIFSSRIQAAKNNNYISYPKTKFAIITDPHVFETDNNIDNLIYLKYGINDRNLLTLSTDILKTAIYKIIQEKEIDFFLVI